MIDLIRETIYSELPDIISEIKQSVRNELIAEMQTAEQAQSVRDNIRQEFRRVNPLPKRKTLPEGRNLKVNYGGEKVASGKGVLEWFAQEAKTNPINPAGGPEFKHTDSDMKNFMSQKFGKKIK